MSVTKIEWTERTWNPVTGCTKISAGCAHCYAEIMANRLKAMGVEKYSNGFLPTVHEDALDEPISWKAPHTIFVCSMADLFHESVPFSFIDRVMDTIQKATHHRYQILTKRAGRMAEYFGNNTVPSNVWLGVTVEDVEAKSRIEILRNVKASVRFLSCEPLLEDLGRLDLSDINWIIVGGESGVQARPMSPEWVMSLQAQANDTNIPFFFKQWGTWGSDGIKRSKKANGKLLDGKIVQAMPPFNVV